MRILSQAEQWPERCGSLRVAMPWYHVSPNELPPGTMLTPGGGPSLNQDMYDAHPNNFARSQHVWVTDTPDHAAEWSAVMAEDSGRRPGFMYEVEPSEEPAIFDEEYPDDEWVTPSATIKRLHQRWGPSGWETPR